MLDLRICGEVTIPRSRINPIITPEVSFFPFPIDIELFTLLENSLEVARHRRIAECILAAALAICFESRGQGANNLVQDGVAAV